MEHHNIWDKTPFRCHLEEKHCNLKNYQPAVLHSACFLGTGKSINLLDTFFLSINQREMVHFFLDPSALWNTAVALADTYMMEWCDANADKRSKSIKWATKSSKIKWFFARHVIQATWDCFVAVEASKWCHIYWLARSPHHSILLTGWLV